MAYKFPPASYAIMLLHLTSSKSAPDLQYKSSTSSISTDDDGIMSDAESFCSALPTKIMRAACCAYHTISVLENIEVLSKPINENNFQAALGHLGDVVSLESLHRKSFVFSACIDVLQLLMGVLQLMTTVYRQLLPDKKQSWNIREGLR